MSGLFGTLNTANKGLMASQTAMQTTGHNVNNANTRGYTRQRVNFQADKAFNYVGVGQLGTGVRMTSITRTSNEFINRQVWNEGSSLDRYKVKSDIMGQLEGIFNEPSNSGLNNDLNQVLDAWSDLAKDPGNLTAKTVVTEKMKALTDNINHMYSQMDGLKTETESQLGQGIKDFNSTIEKLDQLNEQIFYVSIRGQEPNDLLDQRDVLIEDLNKNTSVNVEFDEYGRTRVSLKADLGKYDAEKGKEGLNKSTVLDYGRQLGKLEIQFKEGDKKLDSPKINLVSSSKGDSIKNDINSEEINAFKSGSFKGNFEAVAKIDEMMSKLEGLSVGITEVFNKIHGNDELFTEANKANGQVIKFNDAIYKDPGKIVSGMDKDSPAGDGTRADAMANLKNTKFTIEKVDGKYSVKNLGELVSEAEGKLIIKSDPSGNTVAGHYGGIITGLGIDKQQADDMVDNQELLVHQLEARRQSEAGVSINEEVTDMIKFQASYEANARVIQTIADMLDTLINRTGV